MFDKNTNAQTVQDDRKSEQTHRQTHGHNNGGIIKANINDILKGLKANINDILKGLK